MVSFTTILALAAGAYAASSGVASASAKASASAAPSDCDAKHNACVTAPDANFSYCASQYAACLGYNPYANNTGSATSSAADVYVTQVVTAFTTVCPSPTTFTYQSKTYTVTKATTLTITDCPCKVTVPCKSLPPASTVTAVVSSYTTVCPSPTTVTIGSQTWTVKSSTTLTVTSCPGGCTVTTPVSVIVPPTASASVSVTKATWSTGSVITPTTTSTQPARFTGAADKVSGGGALLIGALGLLAL